MIFVASYARLTKYDFLLEIAAVKFVCLLNVIGDFSDHPLLGLPFVLMD